MTPDVAADTSDGSNPGENQPGVTNCWALDETWRDLLQLSNPPT